MAAASFGARRGIGGGVCTRTGVDMDGRRSVLPEASVSLVEALFDAPVAALWLAAKILLLKVRSICGFTRQDNPTLTALAEKLRISILVSRRSYLSTTFLRAHHVQV